MQEVVKIASSEEQETSNMLDEEMPLLAQQYFSTSDLFGIFLLGVATQIAQNSFLLGIGYFSHAVYDSPQIFTEICMAIYVPCCFIVLLQLYFDPRFDKLYGSARTYEFRIFLSLIAITGLNLNCVFLPSMYAKDDGESPSSFYRYLLLCVIALISTFAWALNGTMFQFISFSDSKGRGLASLTSGGQFSGICMTLIAFAVGFNESASSTSVTTLWVSVSIFVLCIVIYYVFTFPNSSFIKHAFQIKDSQTAPDGFNTISLRDISMELTSSFLTIFASTFVLTFYAMFKVHHKSTHQLLVVAKLVSDFLSRPFAAMFVPSTHFLFYASIFRFCFIPVFLLMLWDTIRTPTDSLLVFIIALWSFTSGMLTSWSYFLAASKMESPHQKTEAGAYMNVAFNMALGFGVIFAGIWNATFFSDIDSMQWND